MTDAIVATGGNAVAGHVSKRRVRSFPRISTTLRKVVRYPKRKKGK